MTATHGPARQLVAQADENAVACAAREISDAQYTATWFELCAAADAHDATFAALVEAAEAIDRLNDDWDFSSMLDEPVEYGFITRDSFARLRAALDAAKGG